MERSSNWTRMISLPVLTRFKFCVLFGFSAQYLLSDHTFLLFSLFTLPDSNSNNTVVVTLY